MEVIATYEESGYKLNLGKGLSVSNTNVKRMMVFMMKRRITLIICAFLAITILVQGTPVSAHTPGSPNLSYDFPSQVLTIAVSHNVADVNTHYIVTVIIEKNSVEVLRRDYTSQNSTTSFSATYNLPATHGDVLSVTAICFISGQSTNEITVSDPAATTTDTTTEPSTTPTNGNGFPIEMPMIIAIVVVALGVVLLVVVLLKRR
jgi:hypothetical protein